MTGLQSLYVTLKKPGMIKPVFSAGEHGKNPYFPKTKRKKKITKKRGWGQGAVERISFFPKWVLLEIHVKPPPTYTSYYAQPRIFKKVSIDTQGACRHTGRLL